MLLQSQEANYFAIKKIWNPGIEVILVYKRFWRIISNNIGFISMIDCERLSNNEKKMVSLLGVPKKYKVFWYRCRWQKWRRVAIFEKVRWNGKILISLMHLLENFLEKAAKKEKTWKMPRVLV